MWEEESRKSFQESSQGHLVNHRNFIHSVQPQQFNQTLSFEKRGMPRSKRRAPSSTNNHPNDMTTGAQEEMSRIPSKRLRHTSRLVLKMIKSIFKMLCILIIFYL